MSKLGVGVLVLLVLSFAVPAFAVDGVTLINQVTATNGLPGCTRTPPGGFPIVICQSGSYRLSGSLLVSGNTDGIDILADDVTLDLNGFAISGPIGCTVIGIPLEGGVRFCSGSSTGSGILSFANNTAVRNGVVHGFSNGVNLNAYGNLVEDIRASSNSNAGIYVAHALVRRCTATLNLIGIYVRNSTVKENVANANSQEGILAEDSTVTANVANYNLPGAGLVILTGTYGSNSIANNPEGLQALIAVSQGNNSCDGAAC